MRFYRLTGFALLLLGVCASRADVVVRYDAGPAAGPPPISPSNYVFNAVSWTPAIAPAAGITNSAVTNDLASGFNAWNTSDNTGASGSVRFSYPVSTNLDSFAEDIGWSFRARVRVVSSFGDTESCFVEYGRGPSEPRFLIFFGLNSSSNLTVLLQGLGTITLTTNGQGAAAYHVHEIVSDGGGLASYYFDGQLITNNWDGFVTATSVNGVQFGTGSTGGRGSVNYNLVEWEIHGTTPTITAPTATNLATYAATLSAQINAGGLPGTAWFQWGATTNYGNLTATQPVAGGTNVVTCFQPITGLSAGSNYHFRCVASNELGITFGGDSAFTTPLLFAATTLPAGNLEPRRATLSGSVNPSGLAATAWFQWGTTTNYVNTTVSQSMGSGTTAIALTNNIPGLVLGGTYHYRCVASNVLDTVFGQDVEFTTPPVFIVTSLANSGVGTLRQSIANAIAGDTITFGVAGAVSLTSELAISKNLTISATNPALVAVSGANVTRVFNIAIGVTVQMSGLRIRNGRAGDGADSNSTNNPGFVGMSGGGIFNRGTLNLSNCVIIANVSGAGGRGNSDPMNEELPTPGGDGGDGGGIYNMGTLTLTACTVSGNVSGAGGLGGQGPDGRNAGSPGDPGEPGFDGADGGTGGNGGGIYNSGTATLRASTFSGNSAGPGGNGGAGGQGGRGSGPHGTLSGPGGNGARGHNGGHGSAVYNANILSMTSSTVSGNSSGRGGNGGLGGTRGGVDAPEGIGGDGGTGGSGSIYNSGSFALAVSTISGNSTGDGGSGGNANSGGTGGVGGNGGDAGGVINTGPGSAGSLRNTIIALNTTGIGGSGGTPGGSFGVAGFAPDLKGIFTTEGHNLVGKNDGNFSFVAPGTGDQIGSLAFPINPLLGPLMNHGGPTFTMALLSGSPARDIGDDLIAGLVAADQRGFARLSGSHVDIGAFEVQWVTTNNRPLLLNPMQLANNIFQFTFTNIPGAEFTVLTSTNLALPFNSWTMLNGLIEIAPGQFQFTNSAPPGTNRFYLIRWP